MADNSVRFTKNGVKISQKPVVITIFSSKFPDLNIIDLPGQVRDPYLLHAPLAQEIPKKLALHHMSRPESTVVCVLPANCDLTIHDPIKIAFDFNPSQEKIIACLTKIDLMDRGDSATKFLQN